MTLYLYVAQFTSHCNDLEHNYLWVFIDWSETWWDGILRRPFTSAGQVSAFIIKEKNAVVIERVPLLPIA